MDNFPFINVTGASAVKLQEQVKLLNEQGFAYQLTGEESYKDLQAKVKEGQDELKAKIAAAQGGDKGATGNGSAPSETKKDTPKQTDSSGAVYVWLKSPAYVDKDGTKRIAGGLYHIALTDFPRLEVIKRDRRVIELFDEVPSRRLVEIAKFFGVNPDKHKSDEELLKVLLTEPTLF